MNSRVRPPLAAGTRRASVRLLLWLAPAVAISAPSIAPELPGPGFSRPYLAIIGAPALRFAERIASSPDSAAKHPAGAPPQLAKQEPPHSRPDDPASAETKTEPGTTPESVVVIETHPNKEPSGNPPVSILPDDVRPKVRPEDFLPFFQFPGVNHQINTNSTPVGPQVPSSATYRQQ